VPRPIPDLAFALASDQKKTQENNNPFVKTAQES
jgi:hypothetical protein